MSRNRRRTSARMLIETRSQNQSNMGIAIPEVAYGDFFRSAWDRGGNPRTVASRHPVAQRWRYVPSKGTSKLLAREIKLTAYLNDFLGGLGRSRRLSIPEHWRLRHGRPPAVLLGEAGLLSTHS